MIAFIQNLITSVVGAAVILSIAMRLTPDGGAKKTLSLVGGLIMTIIVITPFFKGIPPLELDIPEPPEIQPASGLLKKHIEERTSAYIVNKAQAQGLDVTARVICEEGGMYPIPTYVLVLSSDPEAAQAELAEFLSDEMGITRQVFKER